LKKISKEELLHLGAVLYERLKEDSKEIAGLPLRQYHRFAKYTVKSSWYDDLADPADVMVEIAVVEGPHPNLHYHKLSHATNIILGESHGVEAPPLGSEIVAGGEVSEALEGTQVYFKELVHHTFNAPEGEKFLFLSIQSPPLEKPNGSDDFYWADEH